MKKGYNRNVKTILITGVDKGIGRALARKFLDEKYIVIGTYLSDQPDFSDKYFSCYPLDLSSSASIVSCIKEIDKAKHRFDVQINNAGALFDEEETEVVISKLRQTLEVNLIGTIDFTERMLSHINPGGHIINISSTAGSLELAGTGASHYPYHYPSYKISKAALNMYTRTLAPRLEKKDIVVSSVHPGWVKTDMGGTEAELTPEEAAELIFEFASTHPETGRFWHAGEPVPW